jgi:hypothetical protein
MEETNFNRYAATTPPTTSGENTPVETKDTGASTAIEDPQPTSLTTPRKRKTYLDKLKLIQVSDLHKPNQLKGMMTRPLIFATFPVIFYAGFSYGSNLVWFNVLNATASLILGETYNFSASMVRSLSVQNA